MSALFKTNILCFSFVTELLTHPSAFQDFYTLVEKKRCSETIEFFFVAFYYKMCPSIQRKVMEQQIFDYFVKTKAPKEVNIPEKVRKDVCD
jgi:hypothetical protein